MTTWLGSDQQSLRVGTHDGELKHREGEETADDRRRRAKQQNHDTEQLGGGRLNP